MGSQWQTTYHALVSAWYIIVNIRLCIVGLQVLLTRWDILLGQFGCGLQYLTLWNLVSLISENTDKFSQQGYFFASLKEDLMPASNKTKSRLYKFLRRAFHLIVFPMGILLAIDFWVAYYISPSLLDEFDALIDLLTDVNHSIHTTIFPLVVIELAISDRPRKNISLFHIFINLLSFHVLYLIVVILLNLVSGIWPYPFLHSLNIWEKLILVLVNSIFGVLISFIGYSGKSTVQSVLHAFLKSA